MRISLRLLFKISCSIILFLFYQPAFAQLNILENDTTICQGNSITLHAVSGGAVTTQISLAQDDYYGGVVPIGFNFTFYGTAFNKCVISSNGYITFDSTKANQFSAWSIGSGIPGNNNVLNSIMGHYADIYPVNGGTIEYALAGTAPNRKFVVNFCDVPMFSCTSLFTSFQIILYETSNNIEVHIGNKPLCSGWNSGAGIEGVQDYSGAYATVVPGRNYPGTWTAVQSAHQFVATSATSYSVSPITYNPVPTSSSNYVWYLLGNPNPIGYTQNITVTPTVSPSTYIVRQIHCSDTLRDSVHIFIGGGPHIDSVKKTNPTTCGSSDGYLTLYGLTPNTQYTVYYKKNGASQTPFTFTSSPTGTILINNLGAGVYSGIYVIGSICISNIMGPYTLVNPSLSAAYSYNVRYGCSADTVYFTNQSQTAGPMTYQWQFGDNTGDTAKNPVHIYNTQGVYTVRLRSTNGTCSDTAVKIIDLNHPLHAAFTVDRDSACSRQIVTFTNTSITTTKNGISPQYLWSFGDGTFSNAQSPTHAYNYAGTYHARLTIKDFVPCYDTAWHTIVIDSLPFANFTVSDSVICEGQSVTFTGDYLAIGNLGYVWSFTDGGFNVNQNPVSHSFDSAGVHYIKFTAHYRLCPDTSYVGHITVVPFPGINLGPDTSLCPQGQPITLYDHLYNSNPAAHYIWNTGDSSFSISANNTGTYWATVTINGCSATDSVIVAKDCYVDMPNSFTPNGDGLNDYFFPRQFLSRSVNFFKMSIYDRWGQQIFETTSLDGRGWDGKFNDTNQPQGVYIYMVDVSFANGKKEHYVGNVTLLR